MLKKIIIYDQSYDWVNRQNENIVILNQVTCLKILNWVCISFGQNPWKVIKPEVNFPAHENIPSRLYLPVKINW